MNMLEVIEYIGNKITSEKNKSFLEGEKHNEQRIANIILAEIDKLTAEIHRSPNAEEIEQTVFKRNIIVNLFENIYGIHPYEYGLKEGI